MRATRRPTARRRTGVASTLRRPPPPVRPTPPDGTAPKVWLSRDTADETLAIGLPPAWLRDLYHHTLRMGWCPFLLLGGIVYIALNAGFALVYLVEPGGIANARPGAFADAFFFSVQTMASIGYGQMYPRTTYANLVMTVEAASGLFILALATGLVFARFSRPTARILFSRVAVIGPHNGRPTLSLRLANQRRNQILQAEVAVNLLRDEETAEGAMLRRFYELKLQRYRTPVLAMSFPSLSKVSVPLPSDRAVSVSSPLAV